MARNLKDQVFYIDGIQRCGEMPLFLLLCHNKRGQHANCVIFCTWKNIRRLMNMKKGFTNPEQYGRVLYMKSGKQLAGLMRDVLHARYGFKLKI